MTTIKFRMDRTDGRAGYKYSTIKIADDRCLTAQERKKIYDRANKLLQQHGIIDMMFSVRFNNPVGVIAGTACCWTTLRAGSDRALEIVARDIEKIDSIITSHMMDVERMNKSF